jgi:hypothetical protein
MVHVECDIEKIPAGHPVRLFGDYWVNGKANRFAPAWSEFDIVEHPHAIPWILLLKPEPSGNLRYVICGDGCSRIFGFSFAGKIFGEDLPPEAVEVRKKEFSRAIGGEAPIYSHTSLPLEGRGFIKVFRGVFPFLSPIGELERMIVIIAPDDLDRW